MNGVYSWVEARLERHREAADRACGHDGSGEVREAIERHSRERARSGRGFGARGLMRVVGVS